MGQDTRSRKPRKRDQSTSENVHIRRVDLNLFRVFDAVMRERSVGKAAKALSVTSSAISHSLSRLREAVDDELFLPSGSGMRPTSRAIELASDIRKGLQNFHSALVSKPFVPARAVRTFRIAASDHVSVTVLPGLIKRLAEAAPNIDIRIFPLSRLDAVRHLESEQIDLFIGWFGRLPDKFHRSSLYKEQEAMVVRREHPLTKKRVTKKGLFQFPHVVVEMTGTEEHKKDGFLDDEGVSRRVWIERALLEFQDKDVTLVGRAAVCVPYFAAVVPMLEVTDMVATLPRRLALWLAERNSIVLLKLPYKPITVEIEMVWHERVARDPGFLWFREVLASSAADFAAAGDVHP
ncbi:MAG: LysR family transcriptional regulator [Chthoniobacterales bacterium]